MSGFAPINYNNASDMYMCDTDNYIYTENTTNIINNIDNNSMKLRTKTKHRILKAPEC